MKSFQHLIVIIALVFGAFSCKKDHNCECTLDGETVTTVYKELSSSEAESQCASQNTSYESSGGSCSLN